MPGVEPPPPRPNQARDNLRGAVWILGAALMNAVVMSLVKLTGQTLPPTMIAFFRGVFGLLIMAPIMWRAGPAGFASRQPRLQLLRASSSGIILLAGFYSFVHLPLAQVTSILFSRPLFMLVLAALILGERIRLYRSAATLAGFVGVLIVVRPGPSMDPSALVAVGAALLAASNIVMVKLLTRTDRTETLIFYAVLGQTVVLSVPAALEWQTPSGRELLLLLGVAVSATVLQTCMVRGYRLAEASAMAPFDYSRLLFSTTAGFLIFSEVPDVWTGVGALILVASTFYITRRERQLARAGKR
ncbi:MAG: EamA family transporter [Alphaproteobacteria bacterium]|nr:EamA family transporter [Alphaproteobacteria bacterium]